jgi:hypothetical protein
MCMLSTGNSQEHRGRRIPKMGEDEEDEMKKKENRWVSTRGARNFRKAFYLSNTC